MKTPPDPFTPIQRESFIERNTLKDAGGKDGIRHHTDSRLRVNGSYIRTIKMNSLSCVCQDNIIILFKSTFTQMHVHCYSAYGYNSKPLCAKDSHYYYLAAQGYTTKCGKHLII